MDSDMSFREIALGTDIDSIQKKLAETLDASAEDVIPRVTFAYLEEMKGNLLTAAEGYRKCLETKEDIAFVHFRLGTAEYFLMNFRDSIKHFERALELHPERVMAHYWIARNYSSLMEYQKAIEPYKKLLKSYPGWTTIHMRLGEACVQCGMFDEAQINYEKAIEENPNCAVAYYVLGRLYARRSDTMKAIQTLREGLKYNPDLEVLKTTLDHYTSADMP